MNSRHMYHFSPRLLMLIVLLVSIYSAAAQEPTPDSAKSFSWSPDGTKLAIFADNGVFIYDRDFQLLRYREQNHLFAYGAWGLDGTKLIVGNSILSVDTLETLIEYESPIHTWLNDGLQLITLDNGGREIRIWDTNNGSLIKTIESPIQVEYAVPSPDSSRILVVVSNGIFIFDFNRGELAGQYLFPVHSVNAYTWSPDGSQIAFAAFTLVPAGTKGSVPNADPNTAIVNTLNILDSITGDILLTSDPLSESVSAISWSKNMPRLAGVSRSGSVYIWDAEKLSILNTFSVLGEVTGRIAYSPYGGVVVIGINPETVNPPSPMSNQNPELISEENTSALANNTLQIVVPEVSLEYLAAIQSVCSKNGNSPLAVPQTDMNLANYIFRIESATPAQIPPACKADLLAVAEALQAEQ
ncbi:MAG: hypothetical protein K8L97_11085 [Anaerolineae bacterium]|nr:hypothetical protein [Anaerolineae bacterium]